MAKLIIDPVAGTINKVFTNGTTRTNVGTAAKSGHLHIRVNGEMTLVHRVIWTHVNGPIPDGFEIDHINGLPSDNRISNLRLVTRSENTQNRHQSNGNSTSRVKGVTWNKAKNKWTSQICYDRVHHYLGSFVNIEDAKTAYGNAASLLHTHNPYAVAP